MFTISADNLSAGIASSAFVAYLSGLVNQAYSATQYALFSSLVMLPGKVLSAVSGGIVEQVGYGVYFAITTAVAVPAVLLFFWLKPRLVLSDDGAAST